MAIRNPLLLMAAGLGLLFAQLPAFVLAQQVPTDPTSTHIFPAGGRRGTTVQVRVGGECLPPQTRFRLAGEGVTSPKFLGARSPLHGEPSPRRKPNETAIFYPKEWDSTVEIPVTAPLGPRLWWLSCARGGTGGRPFLIGDLPEFLETESNSTTETAEHLTLPVTLNGQICGERDRDCYSFTASRGEIIVAEVIAARIGSPLETVLEFRDGTGKQLPTQEVRVGDDPVVALKVPTTGKYFFSVANLSVAGGPQYVYRITLSQDPFARLAFPGGGQAGQTQDFELLTLSGEARFVSQQQTLLLPIALETFWWRAPGKTGLLPLTIGQHPEQSEREPNNTREQATKASLPAILNGRFDQASDEDFFLFTAKAGQAITVACQSAGAGLPTLPIISLHDQAGKELARASAVDVPDRLPALESWTAPADGEYALRVRDVQQGVNGGPEFLYRLKLEQAVPDFNLTLKSDSANHLPGGRTEVEVLVRRRGGFAGPVKVEASGLPAGVRAEPLEIPAGAPSGKLAITSDAASALPGDALLTLSGTAQINDAPMTRTALAPHLGRDVEGVSVGSPITTQFHLTVQHKPLFRLFCNEAYQYAYRGTIHRYLMEVERFDGFNGPITLQIADRQIKDLDGADVLETTIPAGESQIMLPLYLPESMHINVQAHSNIYAQGIAVFADRAGQKQSTCVVSEMRCMVRTLPTVVRLLPVDRELTLAADGTASCRLRLERTSNYSGPIKIELCADASSAGLAAEPVTIPANQSDALLMIRRVPGQELPTKAKLQFRGTGELAGGTVVVTEAAVSVQRAK